MFHATGKRGLSHSKAKVTKGEEAVTIIFMENFLTSPDLKSNLKEAFLIPF